MDASELTGAYEIVAGYEPFEPPTTIKKGNSPMADNWDRYIGAGRDDEEKAVWKKYAGNLSTTESARPLGNNKLAKQNETPKGAWALSTLVKVVYRWKEMKQKSGKKVDKEKKARKKMGKKDAKTNAQRSTNDLTGARTEFLDDLRNTVAGVAAKKILVENLVEDHVHLKDANRSLSHNVSSMATRPQ
ncbi:hypothetical protein CEP54_008651 [Fusarium duplospermum]|uniref:Uncharacterized protein n=1 Tax=Fusarium duplospermum TaxID=1325734 RepID=A0A428PUS0_9HYPO|nr:hypothetical protein CEP54_008651 [Fusarium duplospermum]